MDSPTYTPLLIPLFALGVNAASQTALIRIAPGMGLLRSVFAGFFLGSAALAAGGRHYPGYLLPSALTYAALGYCYFHFLNLGTTARRVRILLEMLEAGGTLSREALLSRYSARAAVSMRIKRLVQSGQVLSKSGRLHIANPSVLYMSRALAALRKFLKMEAAS